jgi:hypothetical protein
LPAIVACGLESPGIATVANFGWRNCQNVAGWHGHCSGQGAEFMQADQGGSRPSLVFGPRIEAANPSPFGTLFP